jgi:hypothetical protein
MEDVELYLGEFNQTIFGKLILQILHPVLGFYTADFVVICFSLLSLSTIALLTFSLIKNLIETDPHLHIPQEIKIAVSGLITLIFVLLNRELFSFTYFTTYITYGFLLSLKRVFSSVVLLSDGNWLTRFYQPGVALLFFFLCVIAVEKIRNNQAPKTGISISIMLSSAWALSSYPWIGLALVGYLLISLIGIRRLEIKRYMPLCIGITALLLFFAFNTLMQPASPDYLKRVGATFSRYPDQSILFNNFLVLLLCLLFRRYRMGNLAIRLQIGNIFAVSSPVLIGYMVQPYHFQYVPMISLALVLGNLLAIFLNYLNRFIGGNNSRTWLNTVVGVSNWAIVLLLLILGANKLIPDKAREYYYIPEDEVNTITSLQAECFNNDLFFSTDVAMWWAVPARTNCRNIIPIGLNKSLSNQQIANQFSAIMAHYKVFSSQIEFEQQVNEYVAAVGGDMRETVRSQYLYSQAARNKYHTLWYLFHSGYNEISYQSYLASLFLHIDILQMRDEWEIMFSNANVVVVDQ